VAVSAWQQVRGSALPSPLHKPPFSHGVRFASPACQQPGTFAQPIARRRQSSPSALRGLFAAQGELLAKALPPQLSIRGSQSRGGPTADTTHPDNPCQTAEDPCARRRSPARRQGLFSCDSKVESGEIKAESFATPHLILVRVGPLSVAVSPRFAVRLCVLTCQMRKSFEVSNRC